MLPYTTAPSSFFSLCAALDHHQEPGDSNAPFQQGKLEFFMHTHTQQFLNLLNNLTDFFYHKYV